VAVAKLAEVDIVTSHLRKQCEQLRKEAEQATERAEKAEEIWNELGMSEQEVLQLKSAVEDRQRTIEALQNQISNLSTALAASSFFQDPPQSVVQALSEATTTGKEGNISASLEGSQQVSVQIIGNLVKQYFTATGGPQQKVDLLIILTKILKMSDADRLQVF
jgi:predicted  nucleic acid-binding Zn-ribbon protein